MNSLSRRNVLRLAGCAGWAVATAALAQPVLADKPVLEVYRSPTCGCCGAWVSHMRSSGFDTRVIDVDDLAPIKSRLRVAPDLWSCHTAIIEGYVIEGHVPAGDVKRLLSERPAALGLAVPGMPAGAPGMEQGGARERYRVYIFSQAGRSEFAEH